MGGFKFRPFMVVLGLLCILPACFGESSTCLMVYKEGGAPAVFQSPKCPLWKHYDFRQPPATVKCQSAMLQGRRKYQEDRTFCVLDVPIPFLGTMGLKEVMVGLLAVFDGHGGAEASEMASKLLLDYFVLHIYFLLDATYSVVLRNSFGSIAENEGQHVAFQVLNWGKDVDRHDSHFRRFKLPLPAIFDRPYHLEILKESLLRAIHDIDVRFTEEAIRNNLHSGTTATVVLIADGQILVANVGDSKALLCSERVQSPEEAKANLIRLYRQKRRNGAILPVTGRSSYKSVASNGLAHFVVMDLTKDHHPDRDDERSRVENAGGYVLDWGGVARVNGQLAVSRAIGDVSFKSYGVVSTPELTDWQALTANDSYLVAASDGVFEQMSSQDVCDLLWEESRNDETVSSSYSLADYVVGTAFERGSMDNLAAVVVPLSTIFSLNEKCYGPQKCIYGQSANDIRSNLVQMERTYLAIDKFDRLLVEEKHGNLGYFYLAEKLNENLDDDVRATPQALPLALDHHCAGILNLSAEETMCLHFGLTIDGVQEQCINPEAFANFLNLLESISFHDDSSHESSDYAMPNSRYVLKKRFGRGSYGEVWLAFHLNCSQNDGASDWSQNSKKCSFNSIHLDSYNTDSSYSHEKESSLLEDNLLVLKRILVEKGTTFYLSGIREKYFGEVFLNASKSLGGTLSAGESKSVLRASSMDLHCPIKENISICPDINIAPSSKFRHFTGLYEEGLHHIARYIESFESQANEIWLVFRHEGVSLSKLLYTVGEVEDSADVGRGEKVNQVQVLHPSKWWYWLKKTQAGHEEMRNLIWQLLLALKSCHDRNITHRDVKPENMMICFEDQETGRCSKGIPTGDKDYVTKMRIIDFGSAMDDFTVKHLYGSSGPSRAEQTSEYTPPEALLNTSWYKGSTSTTLKYDMWSVGVVILEMILGSPNVFQINAVTRLLLDRHLEGWNESLKELAYKLRSLIEMCILIPGSSSKYYHVGGTKHKSGVSPASWKCSEEFFSHQIKSRDPLKLGFTDIRALRLVRQLLLWDAEDRLSIDEALQHPYFQPPPFG